MDGHNISVVMITMNEEAAIKKVLTDIKAVVPAAEIIIVDSSRDRTREIAESLGATVIQQLPPKGYGPAMDLALRSAARDIVITLDCDDTYPVDAIPQFVNTLISKHLDVLDGCRLHLKPQAMPWINYLANIFFARFASLLFFINIKDLHSGMRAYKRTILDTLAYNSQGAALPVELLLLPVRMGMKVDSIDIDYHERIGTSTLHPLDSAWWTLKRILSCRFRKI